MTVLLVVIHALHVHTQTLAPSHTLFHTYIHVISIANCGKQISISYFELFIITKKKDTRQLFVMGSGHVLWQ